MSIYRIQSDTLYSWYESLEEPLWMSLHHGHALSWWLRQNKQIESESPNWFTDFYPVLAPYYPFVTGNGELVDPTAQYMGYWWP